MTKAHQAHCASSLTDSKAVLHENKQNVPHAEAIRGRKTRDVKVLMLGYIVYSQGYTIDVLVFLPLTASARSSSVCFHGGQPSRSTSARLLLLLRKENCQHSLHSLPALIVIY